MRPGSSMPPPPRSFVPAAKLTEHLLCAGHVYRQKGYGSEQNGQKPWPQGFTFQSWELNHKKTNEKMCSMADGDKGFGGRVGRAEASSGGVNRDRFADKATGKQSPEVG